MISTKKYYFLPFLDNLTAVVIALVIIIPFGRFFLNPLIATIGTLLMICGLFGRVYVRMWKLSRRNTRYHYKITKKDFVRFIIPLVIFDLLLAIFYCLCEYGIIPLDKIIVSSYYAFPENEARQLVTISLYDYTVSIIKIWFFYLITILKNGFVLFLAPILSYAAAILGYKLGDKDIQLKDMHNMLINKIKK